MTLELLPTINIMLNLYQLPRTPERFEAYLKLLQSNTKGDLLLPISGYNPMAKEPLIAKLTELKQLEAEKIMGNTLEELNKTLSKELPHQNFKVALNLCDDVAGGWTNRFTTDYDSKFNLNGLLHRNFCTPLFWASELYTAAIIKERTMEYVYRTLYRQNHSNPTSLAEHIAQEIVVYNKMNIAYTMPQTDFDLLNNFYQNNKENAEYATIVNFFYGSTATASLGFSNFEIGTTLTGVDYCKVMAVMDV
jgi:hypothetical protein